MKLSTLFVITVILLVFLTVQGWLINQRFWAPHQISAQEAVLQGATTDVRAPISGTVRDVNVQEDQKVKQGDVIFTMTPPQRSSPVTEVTAPSDGVLTNLTARPGMVLRGDESVGQVVDASKDALLVRARLVVPPDEISKIRPRLLATVHASYLNGGKPMDAMVTAVDPLYDAKSHTIDVLMRFLKPPTDMTNVAVGLPVDVSFERNQSVFQRIAQAVAGIFTPSQPSAPVADASSASSL